MVYIALLRGINVGGKFIVSMVMLKNCFERLGFNGVKTYINSGNVIFSAEQGNSNDLAQRIETALDRAFDPGIRVLVKTREEFQKLAAAIPEDWVNDVSTKCDVMFLWPEIDNPQAIEHIPANAEIEEVRYLPGAILWHINRQYVHNSRVPRIIGTSFYKQLTIRNVNTTRKLISLANEVN